ncbi:unnamed protein product [Pleuronectes platessa]|uniref:Uncharacterized protein n=1 Tax=Pleuronectes platessa TaxID=8262 RepID=A0A9N7VZL0_PLEPL|nr:unnamed protein product [Pleuronectes platessa]
MEEKKGARSSGIHSGGVVADMLQIPACSAGNELPPPGAGLTEQLGIQDNLNKEETQEAAHSTWRRPIVLLHQPHSYSPTATAPQPQPHSHSPTATAPQPQPHSHSPTAVTWLRVYILLL